MLLQRAVELINESNLGLEIIWLTANVKINNCGKVVAIYQNMLHKNSRSELLWALQTVRSSSRARHRLTFHQQTGPGRVRATKASVLNHWTSHQNRHRTQTDRKSVQKIHHRNVHSKFSKKWRRYFPELDGTATFD